MAPTPDPWITDNPGTAHPGTAHRGYLVLNDLVGAAHEALRADVGIHADHFDDATLEALAATPIDQALHRAAHVAAAAVIQALANDETTTTITISGLSIRELAELLDHT